MAKRKAELEIKEQEQEILKRYTYHPDREPTHRARESTTVFDLSLIGLDNVFLAPGKIIEINSAQMHQLMKDASFRQMLESGALTEIDYSSLLPAQVEGLPEANQLGAIAQCANVQTLYQYALTLSRKENKEAIAIRIEELRDILDKIENTLNPKDQIVEISKLPVDEAIEAVKSARTIEVLNKYLEDERQAVRAEVDRRIDEILPNAGA